MHKKYNDLLLFLTSQSIVSGTIMFIRPVLSSVLLTVALLSGSVAGFLTPIESLSTTRFYRSCARTSSSSPIVSRHAIISDQAGIDQLSTSTLLLSVESWRQYVPLAVTGAVILDILLGSPVANMALSPLREAQEGNDGGGGKEKAPSDGTSKERVDSDQIAKAALDRAQNMLELKNMLEKQKTDWDRMEELKRSLDRQMQNLDEELATRQKSIDQRK